MPFLLCDSMKEREMEESMVAHEERRTIDDQELILTAAQALSLEERIGC